MASVFRFRVTAGVGSNRLAVGPKAYASGQEFTLTDDQVARWLDERMFELGYLVMADEMGYDEPQAWNTLAQHLVSGNHPHGGRQPTPDTALAGGRDQGQVPGAGNQQKQDDCGDKSAIVGYAKHGWISQRHEAREAEFTLAPPPCGRIKS